MPHRYQEDASSSTSTQGMCIQASRRRVVAIELVGEKRVRESQARLVDATQATLAGAGVSSVVSYSTRLQACRSGTRPFGAQAIDIPRPLLQELHMSPGSAASSRLQP